MGDYYGVNTYLHKVLTGGVLGLLIDQSAMIGVAPSSSGGFGGQDIPTPIMIPEFRLGVLPRLNADGTITLNIRIGHSIPPVPVQVSYGDAVAAPHLVVNHVPTIRVPNGGIVILAESPGQNSVYPDKATTQLLLDNAGKLRPDYYTLYFFQAVVVEGQAPGLLQIPDFSLVPLCSPKE